MQKKAEGQFYAPKRKSSPVLQAGRVQDRRNRSRTWAYLRMCNGLTEAGATVEAVHDPGSRQGGRLIFREALSRRSGAVGTEEELLEDPSIRLVAAAPIPLAPRPFGLKRVMSHGKDYFCDKPPFIDKADIALARAKVKETGRKYGVYYSERLHVEASVYAERLIADGAIGKVIQVIGTGPHRISLSQRPAWFFDKKKYGGIIVDLVCHQIEQILFFSGAKDARIAASRVATYKYKEYPDFEDFGDVSLVMDNGASGYFTVHWFTPDGLGAWGDGRTFIQGTDGYLELRKYIDVAADPEGDHVILVNKQGEYHFKAPAAAEFPFLRPLFCP